MANTELSEKELVGGTHESETEVVVEDPKQMMGGRKTAKKMNKKSKTSKRRNKKSKKSKKNMKKGGYNALLSVAALVGAQQFFAKKLKKRSRKNKTAKKMKK